jgi:hypothetical protein
VSLLDGGSFLAMSRGLRTRPGRQEAHSRDYSRPIVARRGRAKRSYSPPCVGSGTYHRVGMRRVKPGSVGRPSTGTTAEGSLQEIRSDAASVTEEPHETPGRTTEGREGLLIDPMGQRLRRRQRRRPSSRSPRSGSAGQKDRDPRRSRTAARDRASIPAPDPLPGSPPPPRARGIKRRLQLPPPSPRTIRGTAPRRLPDQEGQPAREGAMKIAGRTPPLRDRGSGRIQAGDLRRPLGTPPTTVADRLRSAATRTAPHPARR